MITLSKLCYNDLCAQCLQHFQQPPQDVRTVHRLRHLLEALPPRYKQHLVTALLPMLQARFGHIDGAMRAHIRVRVANVVVLCVAVDNKFCFRALLTRGMAFLSCDCVTKLNADIFRWCFSDIAERVASLPLRSLHLSVPSSLCDRSVTKLLSIGSIESLMLPMDWVRTPDVSMRLFSANNMTELRNLSNLHTIYLKCPRALPHIVSTLAHLVCKTQLPHLSQFYFSPGGLPLLLSHESACPCAVQCLKRLTWLNPNGVRLSREEITGDLLQVLGLDNAWLSEGTLLQTLLSLDYSDWDIRVSANFSVVNSVTSDGETLCYILRNQPHLTITNLEVRQVDFSPGSIGYFQSLLSLVGASVTVQLHEKCQVTEDEVEQLLRLVSESEVSKVAVIKPGVNSLRQKFPNLTFL